MRKKLPSKPVSEEETIADFYTVMEVSNGHAEALRLTATFFGLKEETINEIVLKLGVAK